MSKLKSKYLTQIIKKINDINIDYCLLWETAIFAWGISNNGHLQKVDILISKRNIGQTLKESKNGYLYSENPDLKDVRFWTVEYLQLDNQIEVTECQGYGCFALAPEVQLQKIQYFPEKNSFQEDIARLAATVYMEELTESDYAYYCKYVRN